MLMRDARLDLEALVPIADWRYAYHAPLHNQYVALSVYVCLYAIG